MSDASTLLARLDARPDDWRKEMLALYDQGASDREIMRDLQLTPDQWKVLCRDPISSDFLEIVELGKLLQQAWWESLGRKNLFNNKFNTPLYKFLTGVRFGWSEKMESSMTNIDFTNMDNHALMKEIRELLAKAEKTATTPI